MKMELSKQKRRWITILSVCILVSEILFDAGTFFLPENNLVLRLVHLSFSFGIVIFMVKLLGGIDKTSVELHKSNQKLRNIFDTLDVAIWSHDMKANTLIISPEIEKIYGYAKEEFYQDLSLWKKVIDPEDNHVLAERTKQLQLGLPVTSFYRIKRPDGEVRWIQDRGIPTLDDKGKLVDFTSVLFDITDRRESEDLYRSLIEMSPDIISVISNRQIDYINETGSRLVGASSPGELIGKPISAFASQHSIKEIRKVLRESEQTELGMVRFEMEATRLDGGTIDVEMSAMPILYEGRHARQVVGRDITERKKAERTIQYMAYYDSLTGLPNRNMFGNTLHTMMEEKTVKSLAVLFLDIDRFKIINDTKGHTIGDLLLKQVAHRLDTAVHDEGLVSRQGGDEFIILLKDMDKEYVESVAQRILFKFAKPFVLNGEEFFVTPSIGISMFPGDGMDQDTLIKHADTAMYLAKEKGKNNYQFYTPDLDKLSMRKMELEKGLRKALAQNEFVLHYQPQVEVETGIIVGIEALIRWEHPKLGMIPPGEFIPLAEETGLIVQMGKWVLRTASEQNKKWQDEGIPPVPVAVNVSVRQIQDDGLIHDVKQILEQTGLEPRYLELEITESIMQNIERSTVILNQLKDLGVLLSLDDFGKGYSSLSYLKHLPIDIIKIDKSFIDDILELYSPGSIAKAIIDMGQNMNFTVIAEGIEKEEQVKFLLENSCKIGQGYYFSKPVPADKISDILQRRFQEMFIH
ncbi:diguanylate cyclase (GGDEF)-like protein/PAS domain S-box-containing protein [Peribacillus deserti]|uniref:Diguanylate cyclase (GGDEF)-like protein/PAS domain S-box-containing protein n=1 Tax=Peribacillus deserti TaxID=673318 RepID=A0ABS2QMS2_9BACI|nr:bifunctional diguanylate cyclase/phosphodiesterase [Peribacillus deserti]MBM7694407.1 diguanylate cyclase (GGDEF)-like protein/PAS domain S-box-containing protein [Peribacillus deserti]